jgi:hypothetical protein
MSKQNVCTNPCDTAVNDAGAQALSLELKPEWVQQTLKIERVTLSQVPGADDQPIGEVHTEERMSIVLPAGSSLDAARTVLTDFVSSLG